MIILGIIGIFALGLIGITGFYNRNIINEKSSDASLNLVEFLQNEVITASKMKNGYIKHFNLPEKIGNKEYSIITSNNSVSIFFDNKEFIKIIPKINGDFSIPSNVIKKKGGKIFVN